MGTMGARPEESQDRAGHFGDPEELCEIVQPRPGNAFKACEVGGYRLAGGVIPFSRRYMTICP